MNFERDGHHKDLEYLHDKCKKHAYYHVVITLKDGSTHDGIIEDVDMDGVNMLVGEDVMEDDLEGQYDEERQFHMHGFPRRRFRRFRRRRFPLASLAALSLLAFPVFPFQHQHFF